MTFVQSEIDLFCYKSVKSPVGSTNFSFMIKWRMDMCTTIEQPVLHPLGYPAVQVEGAGWVWWVSLMINLFGPCKTTVLLSDPSALTVTTVLELHVVTSSWHAFGNPNSFFSLQGPKALGPCTRAKGVSNYLLQYPLSSSLIPSIPTPGMSSSYFCPSSPQISQTLPLTCPVS